MGEKRGKRFIGTNLRLIGFSQNPRKMLQVSLKIVDPLLLLWLHEDRVSDQYVFASPISIVHSAVVVDIKVGSRRNCGVTSLVFLLIEQIIDIFYKNVQISPQYPKTQLSNNK